MAYTENKAPLDLTELTNLASGDAIVIGDADDANEKAKYITKVNFKTDLGVGIAIETPSGTINGSNTAFTVSNEPVFVWLNGNIYFDGAGYTYSAGTITFASAPVSGSVIRSVYNQ